jgi:branched-chain amino acid aminotransferase
MDGEFVPYADAKIPGLSHSLHEGLGVFEGIRAYEQTGGGGGVFKLDIRVISFADTISQRTE